MEIDEKEEELLPFEGDKFTPVEEASEYTADGYGEGNFMYKAQLKLTYTLQQTDSSQGL